MLRKLYDNFPTLHDVIVNTVIRRYRLDVDKLPPSEDQEACRLYRAPLCREFSDSVAGDGTSDGVTTEVSGNDEEADYMSLDVDVDADAEQAPPGSTASHDTMPELVSPLSYNPTSSLSHDIRVTSAKTHSLR